MKALRHLACGCNHCRKELDDRFLKLVMETWNTDERRELIDAARIGFREQTLAQNLVAYTMKEV